MNATTVTEQILAFVTAHPWWTLFYLMSFRLVSVYRTGGSK